MTTKRRRAPDAIRQRIVALQAELVQAEAAEQARKRETLIALVERAHRMPEVLEFARHQLVERQARHEHQD